MNSRGRQHITLQCAVWARHSACFVFACCAVSTYGEHCLRPGVRRSLLPATPGRRSRRGRTCGGGIGAGAEAGAVVDPAQQDARVVQLDALLGAGVAGAGQRPGTGSGCVREGLGVVHVDQDALTCVLARSVTRVQPDGPRGTTIRSTLLCPKCRCTQAASAGNGGRAAVRWLFAC